MDIIPHSLELSKKIEVKNYLIKLSIVLAIIILLYCLNRENIAVESTHRCNLVPFPLIYVTAVPFASNSTQFKGDSSESALARGHYLIGYPLVQIHQLSDSFFTGEVKCEHVTINRETWGNIIEVVIKRQKEICTLFSLMLFTDILEKTGAIQVISNDV